MELIYAYINNYRNIEKEEISFSSSYHVKYTGATLYIEYEELPFCEILFKKNNITSIHLIVGKTGSGKTNLLSLIGMSDDERKSDLLHNHSRYFLLYHFKENEYFLELAGYSFYHKIEETKDNFDFVQIHCTIKENGQLIASDASNIQPWIITLDTIPSPTPHTASDILQCPVRQNMHCSIFSSGKYLFWKYAEQYLKTISHNPDDSSGLEKKLYCNIFIHGTQHAMYKTVGFSSRSAFLFQLRNIYAEYLLKLLETPYKNAVILPLQDDKQLKHLYDALLSSDSHSGIVLAFHTYQKTCNLLKQIPETFYSSNGISWELGTLPQNISEIIDKLMTQLQGWISSEDSLIASAFEISYKNLSSGEMQFAALFSNIEQVLELGRVFAKNPILLIDEPETYMHPELCRKFMFYLVQLCKNIKQNNGQFIITSHSPFLLSDLPSQCTTQISLDDLTGKCHVNSIAHQTFGGNIHQLLADGFFLSNTIGELSYETLKPISEFFYTLYQKRLNRESFTQSENNILQSYLKLLPYIGDSIIKHRLEELGNFILND